MDAAFLKHIIAVAFCLTASNMPARALDWDTYSNGLYGYRICYPDGLLKPGDESDNGDGTTFTSESGATLKVWGSHNAAGESLGSLAANLVPELNGHSANVSYRRITDSFSVESGRSGDIIFYTKIVLDKDGYRAFQITYPLSEANIYDPVSAKLSACFQDAPEQ